jgi:protein-tyrosine phosphatase
LRPETNGEDQDHERLTLLEGGHNFRDLGGYRTSDGRRLRWGLLFRSGVMATLTDADRRRLAPFGIRVICDLRANGERLHRPTRWAGISEVEIWARDHDSSGGDLLTRLTDPATTATDMFAMMHETYRKLPYEQVASYREIFRRLSRGQLPLLFHCAAGKDRTGVAAALILTALGVPREAVIEEYLISEYYFDSGRRIALENASGTLLKQVPPDIWEPLMHAKKSYLEAMFSQLQDNHGSIEGYIAEQLEIGQDEIDQMRTHLLS